MKERQIIFEGRTRRCDLKRSQIEFGFWLAAQDAAVSMEKRAVTQKQFKWTDPIRPIEYWCNPTADICMAALFLRR
ncbi:MAG: hypothetical protein AAGA74_19425 [Pseudomonadota bacterium]